METPNKLHCMHRPNGDYSCSTTPFGGSAEYIRKDALLEWAREKKERLGKMFDAMPATAIGAKLDACKEFIDKIESL